MADVPQPPPLNFLQNHYNEMRLSGASHIEYVIVNDLSDDVAKGLKEVYERFYQDSVVGRISTLDE